MAIRVLVVDDERDVEPLFKAKFRRLIRQGEVDFRFAFNAQDALELLSTSEHRIVLILSDVNMPGMSGIELLRSIRSLPCDLPVYMITAYGRATEREAMEAGASGFLTKPLNLDAVHELIRS